MPKATSAEENLKVSGKLHLTGDEAHQLIAAAGKRGRYPARDRILLQAIFRHGLRASEACDLRWTDLNLDDGTITVRRKKMGKTSTHTMDRDERMALRAMAKATNSPFVFTTERGGPLSVGTVEYIV